MHFVHLDLKDILKSNLLLAFTLSNLMEICHVLARQSDLSHLQFAN